jgi:hypothetical protein
MGGIAFLIRSYFQRIQEDTRDIQTTLKEESRAGAKVEGALEMLAREVKAQGEAATQLRGEINAMWRFLEGSHARVTDKKGGLHHVD